MWANIGRSVSSKPTVGGLSTLCYSRCAANLLIKAYVIAMSVDAETVRRVAHLARVAVAEDEVERLRGELNAMLAFVERLG